MVKRSVSIPLPGGASLDAVLVTPTFGTRTHARRPGVVIVHEIFGVAPEMVEVAERFASRDWVAVVPDLFSDGLRIGCVIRALLESQTGRSGRVSACIDAVRAWLVTRPDVHADQLAVIGFCMGGALALNYTALAPGRVKAASVNYCHVPRDGRRLRESCPVVASFGARDRILGRHAQRLERHLASAGVAHDVKLYPDAGHCFMTDGHHPIGRLLFLPLRIAHAPAEAEDAWARTFSFLERYVGAS